jgi:hypothetical protein
LSAVIGLSAGTSGAFVNPRGSCHAYSAGGSGSFTTSLASLPSAPFLISFGAVLASVLPTSPLHAVKARAKVMQSEAWRMAAKLHQTNADTPALARQRAIRRSGMSGPRCSQFHAG